MSGTMLHATIADRRMRLSAVRVATAARAGLDLKRGPRRGVLQIRIGAGPDRARLRRGAAEFERLVMRAQARHALADLRRERALALARLAAVRHARPRTCAP